MFPSFRGARLVLAATLGFRTHCVAARWLSGSKSDAVAKDWFERVFGFAELPDRYPGGRHTHSAMRGKFTLEQVRDPATVGPCATAVVGVDAQNGLRMEDAKSAKSICTFVEFLSFLASVHVSTHLMVNNCRVVDI